MRGTHPKGPVVVLAKLSAEECAAVVARMRALGKWRGAAQPTRDTLWCGHSVEHVRATPDLHLDVTTKKPSMIEYCAACEKEMG